MPSGGLLAWGSRFGLRARALGLALGFPLLGSLGNVGCGSEDGKHTAVECRSDEDCDATELGVCDVATCVEGRCQLDSQPDGHRCDDSDPLTGEDACLSGICAGVALTCEDELGPCLKSVYDPESDECVVEPVEDGVPCDDADACTQLDSCQAGECVGAEPKTCEATDDCHVAGECDPETGECSQVNAEDGTACDDGRLCTSSDSCQDGACSGVEPECDDGLTCSVDSCDEASGSCGADVTQCSCEQDEDCSDGNLCNGVEHCDLGSKLCQAGTATVCPSSTDPCLRNVCQASTGGCEPEPTVNGTLCDDGNACTGSDTCQEGACVGSDDVVCTALSQCHTPGTCDASTGLCDNPEKPANSPCSDADACTATDSCQAGACVGTGQVTCPASDQCHDPGVCNAATGGCSNPAKPDGVGCDDGDKCSSGDACQSGSCTPSTQTSCAALDGCHLAGTCDSATGNCTNPPKPDGSACNDNSVCTPTDTCTGGKCGGAVKSCDDGVACSVDSCSDKVGGCESDRSNCPCTANEQCNDGNPCNGVETCDQLQCKPGTAVNCSAFDDTCNVGVCNPASGACSASPKQNGTLCDDADACTPSSSCQGGTCTGANRKVCTASDQCHDAGVCNASTGTCTDPPKSNGSTCNDGDACTQTDSCQAGKCTGANPLVCPAAAECRNPGVCNKATGGCSYSVKANGSACSDNNLCTTSDSCQGGLCVGANPKPCTASDQCHVAGTCDPASGNCSNPSKPNNSACSDGDVCTLVDTCQSGVCTTDPTKKQTCRAKDQCHDVGTCDKLLGCLDPPKPDGTACVDPSKCTTGDACQAGVCAGQPVLCAASDQCHDAGSCDPATGACSNPSKPDNTPCNDNKTCIENEKCVAGVCRGSSLTCSDGITCTVDSCVEPTGCKYDPGTCDCDEDLDCDDKNPCNGVESCNLKTLSCVAGTTKDCSGLNDGCNVGVCDRQTGACVATPLADGTACNDGTLCTRTDTCKTGKCVGADPVVCSAGDDCHDAGTCDPAKGQCSPPTAKADGTKCDDKSACSRTDTCQAGKCTGSNPVVCAPSDDCHDAGTCAPATGVCSAGPAKANGSSCNDGSQCTKTDQCQSGRCVGGNAVVCTASDDCHDVGVCAPGTGQCSNPAKLDGSKCDDKSQCTATDSCQAGRCVGAGTTVCTPLGQCYVAGTCDAATGACSNPPAGAGKGCDDTNACTTGEACDGSGNCSRGNPVVCPAPPQCKTSLCDPVKGCGFGNQPPGTGCDDGKVCTWHDQCGRAGLCGGVQRDNASSDWADDPGTRASSVDTFSDPEGNAVIVGVYTAPLVRFNDKDDKTYTELSMPDKNTRGIYWAVYEELKGAIVRVGTIAAGTGLVSVSHATSHLDGSFTLIGTVQGGMSFGLEGTTPFSVAAKDLEGFVAHYQKDGTIAWVAELVVGAQQSFSVDSVAAFDDGAVIAIGSISGLISFHHAKGGGEFAKAEGSGVWAVRFSASGTGQWGGMVVRPDGGATARAVTTHEDGGASLTGGFGGTAKLGLGGTFGELGVQVSAAEVKGGGDIWYEKLDEKGNIKWGGRLGGTALDLAGDVARGKGGGALLLANVLGSGPNADDPQNKVTQPLYATSAGVLQAHVIGINPAGLLVSDGLIADNNGKGPTRGYQLKVDAGGAHAVGGLFSSHTDFWSAVGFGSGKPPAAGISRFIDSSVNGPSTLFAARVDLASRFAWAVPAGGDGSGMATGNWDIVMTGHPEHAITMAGMFKARDISFGDKKTELLSADVELGNPFVVHLNSEAQYDFVCP
jgi:hypothetical protein